MESNIERTPSITERTNERYVAVTPPVDIYENKDEILLLADMPGVPSDALHVRLNGSELVIEGAQAMPSNGGYRPLAFARTFRVPNTVDPNGVTAELRDGVLTLHLAKSEAAKPRRIEVRAS
jgi:HSP20 family molecular chaperone IbpA